MSSRRKSSFSPFLFLVLAGFGVCAVVFKLQWENKILKQVIQRLEADSRAAEVIVTDVSPDASGKLLTTIKFIEYTSDGKPLEPKFFTFRGNLIQFQSLVIRFDDIKVRNGDWLKGKSAYLFWKAFRLAGPETEEYDINVINEIPSGYRVDRDKNLFEESLWRQFWNYALDEKQAGSDNIKNAQVEAPGTRFVPGFLYTLKIEHDGGLRIDARTIPDILQE